MPDVEGEEEESEEEETQEGIVVVGSTLDYEKKITKLETEKEVQKEVRKLEIQLAASEEREKSLKNERTELRRQLKLQNPTNADVLLQLAIILGSLMLVESVSILLGRYLVPDIILLTLAGIGGLIILGVGGYRLFRYK